MAKVAIFILLIWIIPGYCDAQVKAWKQTIIDENMMVMLPENTMRLDTVFGDGTGKKARFSVYKYEEDSISFCINLTPAETKMNIDNPESLKQTYKEIESGMRKRMEQSGFKGNFSDTIVDNIYGVKAICSRTEQGTETILITYIFLLNDKLYSIIFSYINDSYMGHEEDVRRFLQGFHFNPKVVKEKQFGSKAEALGYKTGKVLLPVILVLLVMFFVNRKSKKRKWGNKENNRAYE